MNGITRWMRGLRAALLPMILCAALVIPAPAHARPRDPVEKSYQEAKARYRKLLSSERAKRWRDRWEDCADRFLAIQKKHPKHSRADDSLLMAGRVYRGLSRYSSRSADAKLAVSTLRKLVKGYPKSNLADDAQLLIAEITEKNLGDKPGAYLEYRRLVDKFPKGDMVPKAKKGLVRLKKYKPKPKPKPPPQPKREPPPPAGKTYVRRIAHWSNPNYTRIAIYVDGKVDFGHRLLEKDPQAGKPRRLYVDLSGSVLHPDLTGPIKVKDGLLRQVRTGQFDPDTVRVVLDIESIEKYNVFPLADPFRVVIDVSGEQEAETDEEFARIVIDPGHGGRDPGACHHGATESVLVLDLSKRIRSKLNDRLRSEVMLTRTMNSYLTLEERTAFANKHSADLFVSVHLNASKNRDATGIETYYLSPTRDPETLALVAAENAVSLEQAADINQYIEVGDLGVQSKISESRILADTLHDTLYRKARAANRKCEDRGVRRAPFYVLVGAQMPAVLVEAGFVSNSAEARRLRDPGYRDRLAEGIADGIVKYIDDYINGKH